MNKLNEQGLISGADALRALADGKEVEYFKDEWMDVRRLSVRDLTSSNTSYKFRLKPRVYSEDGEIQAYVDRLDVVEIKDLIEQELRERI